MSITRRVKITALVGATALALAACGGGSPTTSPPAGTTGASEEPTGGESTGTAEDLTIGAMLWNASVPFYSNFIVGLNDAAKDLGVKLQLVDGGGDLGTEVAGIQQLINQGVDAIIVTSSDAQGIAPAVEAAVAAGIPVLAANNRVADDSGAITFIGADDVEFGKQQARLLVEAVGENAKVGYLLGALGTSAQLLREEGLKDVLNDYPGIEIIASQTGNWDAAEALRVVQDWLNRYPEGSIDAIIGQGPEIANAAQWAHESGRTDVLFIAGDYPVEVRQAIEEGYIYGTVNQDPYPQGYRAVEAAVQWVLGEQSKVQTPNEYLELPIVTSDNVADYPPAWGG